MALALSCYLGEIIFMAENKKSVIIYVDIINTFEGLEDDEAGRLIKHFLRYVNDQNPTAPDKLTQIAFEPIKQQLKRDLQKWEEIREKRSEAGKLSANKRQHMSTHVESVQQTSTNPTVTVNVNDTVINNTVRSEQFERFWKYYKKGSKKASREKFLKLTDAECDVIKIHLPAYFKANPDKKFRKDAERYLSNRLWENDDIEQLSQKATLPKDWWNAELTDEQWELLSDKDRNAKKNHDLRKQFGV